MKKQIHVISDGKLSIQEFLIIAREVEPLVDKFHIREKQKTAKDLLEDVQFLIQEGIPLNKIIINDRIDVACVLKTDVQLAFHSLPVEVVKQTFPHLRAGCSIHTVYEAIQAQKKGADFLLYGHVFETNSKKGKTPRGFEELAALKQAVEIPVLAIGGIKPENVKEVLKTGVDGIAIMSGVWQATEPYRVVKQYVQQLNQEG